MLKFAIITEVDAAKGLARVKFDGDDNMVSFWLPMSMAKTAPDKFIIPFDVNEHVWCLMDENMENGVIGGAIYDSKNASTGGAAGVIRFGFVQGLFVEYSRNDKTLRIGGTGDINIDINGTGKGKVNIKCNQATIESLTGAEVKAATEIKLTAPLITCSGALTAASIATTGGGAITGTGNMTITGSITAAEVNEGAIRLGTHKHIGVTTGGGTSGTPVP